MSSKNLSLHCSVDIRPSRRLAALLMFPAMLAMAAVCYSGLPLFPKILLCLLIVLLAITPIAKLAFLRGPDAVRCVVCAGGGWQLIFADETQTNAVPGDAQFVLPFLMVLNFRTETRRASVILLPWNTNADARRRLSVLMLWLKPEQTTS